MRNIITVIINNYFTFTYKINDVIGIPDNGYYMKIKKYCKICNSEFEGYDRYKFCSLNCKKKNDRKQNKKYYQEYFKKRYYTKTKPQNNIEDYNNPSDSAKRDEKGRFIKGSKACLSKHWKVKDSSKMGGKYPGSGFKKGNKLGLGKCYLKGRKASLQTRLKMSESHKGNKSPLWKGGITSLRKQIRNCFQYRQWRKSVFEKDNYSCIICGKRSCIGTKVYLEADHYPISFSEIFHKNKIEELQQAFECKEFWNINNGRTLCKNCHLKTANHGKKNNKLEWDIINQERLTMIF